MEFEQFGPYRIQELLGRGGMGEVYRAFDTEHQRTVALKVLTENLAADRNYRERFRREAYAAARLSEPHIVPIHRYGEIDGRLFLDMRLVRGRDLAGVLAEDGPLSPPRAVSVIGQVAHALDAAHAEGLVHRDVKPSNVLVCAAAGDPADDEDDEDEFVYLVDFGIARSVMDDAGSPALTQVGSAVGSFDYMAPERFLEQPADARTDVYSLACVLFESLTGRRPFLATDLAPLMWAHLNEFAPPVSSLRPGVPSALDEVVARGLAKEPGDRWRSAGALASAARRALHSAGVRARTDVPAPPGAWSGPHAVAQPVGLSDPGRPMPEPFPAGRTATSDTAGAAVPARHDPGTAPGSTSAPARSPAGPEATAAPGREAAPGPAAGPSPGTTTGPAAGGMGATRFLAAPPPPPGSPGRPGPPGPRPSAGTGPGAVPRRRSVLPAVLLATAALLAVALVAVVLVAGSGSRAAVDLPSEPTAGPGHEDLLAIVPPDFDADDCRPAPPADDDHLAAVDCGPSRTQPGPRMSHFLLYPDGEAADAAFAADVERLGVPELTNGAQCPASQGYLNWSLEDEVMGQLACYVDEENTAVLIWTEVEDSALGVVRIRNGGTAGLTQLKTWWDDLALAEFGA